MAMKTRWSHCPEKPEEYSAAMNRLESDVILQRLGIALDSVYARKLPYHAEATELVSIGPDILNREQRLTPAAAAAWKEMQAAAAADSVELLPVSGYRSVAEQTSIIERKLEKGLALAAILTEIAPPGYSEHHSGRAIDIASSGSPPMTESFETTEAYTWLCANAGRFGFTLSFPRDNRYGYCFEPWHWCHGTEAKP
jgi:zinc D-Ala-D-Ala carboxypeptidase